MANVRNASSTTSTPSVWCWNAYRNRLYSAWRCVLGILWHGERLGEIVAGVVEDRDATAFLRTTGAAYLAPEVWDEL